MFWKVVHWATVMLCDVALTGFLLVETASECFVGTRDAYVIIPETFIAFQLVMDSDFILEHP